MLARHTKIVDCDITNLLVNDGTEPGLALDNGVWHTHLSAEGWEEDNKLDRVNIVRDQDKRGLLVLDEADDVVETVLGSVWLLGDVLLLLALADGGGLLVQALLLLGLGLWSVLVEELESLGRGVAVEDVLELSDRRGDLETHVQDLALALESDILWPSHHARKVASGLDVLADTEVTWAALDERVLIHLVMLHVGTIVCCTYLGLLLRDTGLSLREGRRSGFLSRLWRLSLRNAISKGPFCMITLSLKGCLSMTTARTAQAMNRTHPLTFQRRSGRYILPSRSAQGEKWYRV